MRGGGGALYIAHCTTVVFSLKARSQKIVHKLAQACEKKSTHTVPLLRRHWGRRHEVLGSVLNDEYERDDDHRHNSRADQWASDLEQRGALIAALPALTCEGRLIQWAG